MARRDDTAYNRNPMMIDPYNVQYQDEHGPDNLLHVSEDFENLPELSVTTPSSLTSTKYDVPVPVADESLPSVELPAANTNTGATTGTTGTTGTVGTGQTAAPTPAAATVEEMFSPNFSKKRAQELYAQQAAAGDRLRTEGETKEDRLVSTAPSWYKAGPPPQHRFWGDAMGVLGNALTAAPAQRLKDPNRRADLKQKDAQRVALGGGLSTLFSHLFNRGEENYKARQDAALKEAQMMKTLSGGKSGAKIAYDAIKDQIDEAHRERAQESLSQNRMFNQRITERDWNPNDPEAKALAESWIAAGVPAEQVYNMSLKTLRARAPTVNTQMGAVARAGQAEADALNKRAAIEAKAAKDREATDAKAIAEAEQRRLESYIPRVKWVNDTPPPPQTVQKLREAHESLGGMRNRVAEMREIQKRFVTLATQYAKSKGLSGLTAEFVKGMGPLVQWGALPGASQEMVDLANDAVIIQDAIKNAYRSQDYANLGVPQKWEELKATVMAPVAGSPTALLRGESMWKALERNLDNMIRESTINAGGYLEGEEPPGAPTGARTAEQRARDRAPAAPQTTYKYDATKRETVPVETGGASVPVPSDTTGGLGDTGATPVKVPGATPAPTTTTTAPKSGEKMYVITKKDGKKSKPKALDATTLAALRDDPTIASVVEQ